MKRNFAKVFLLGVFLMISVPPVLAREPRTIADIFAQTADSIVVIAVKNKGEWRGQSGSGFIVSEDGLIATNYHLVSRARKILVKLRNRKVYKNAQVVGFDAGKDIAIIKIFAAGLKSVSLGDSQAVRIGERVVSIGNPLGFESSISDGLISGVREIEGGVKIFQTSVPLSKGSSGGPILNLNGEVIGVATASQDGGQNLNFAVPVNYVKALLAGPRHAEQEIVSSRSRKKFLAAQTLSRVAERQEEFVPAKNSKVYIVQPKDTLYSISKRSHTTVEKLSEFNRLKSTRISIGQRLLVPAF